MQAAELVNKKLFLDGLKDVVKEVFEDMKRAMVEVKAFYISRSVVLVNQICNLARKINIRNGKSKKFYLYMQLL